MKNNTQQAIRTQLTAAWRKFQPRNRSSNPAANQEGIEPPATIDRVADRNAHINQRSGYSPGNAAIDGMTDTSSAIANIPAGSRFNDVVAPISKLNLPTVNVDPWSAFWAVLAAMVGGTGITSYLLLIAVPPIPNLQTNF